MSRNPFKALVQTASRILVDFQRVWVRGNVPVSNRPLLPPTHRAYEPLKRVVLTDEVDRTLFEEYAAHRQSVRGGEETGWIILGVRNADEAVVLATLPAGTEANAGVAHVRFNSGAQAMGSRIVRQKDRHLAMLGVVHTHPGSLRHPSEGDFRGDREWVRQLRGNEGIFGIGTADDSDRAHTTDGSRTSNGAVSFARQPKTNRQCLGPLSFSWYSLRAGANSYQPLPCHMTLGPDLARPLHPLWATIEAYAEQLDRLYRQQSGITFDVVEGVKGPTLAVNIPLAEAGDVIRVLLRESEAHYLVSRQGKILTVDPREPRVDRGVYMILAELASQQL